MGRHTIAARRRQYERHFKGGYHMNGKPLVVPEDIERRDEHEPCFNCGVRADIPCKHRPWMLQA